MERAEFDYDGVKMSYLRRRGKYPVVFIHGFTASSDIWSPIIDKLNPDFDVILVDLFGHGKSGFPPIEGIGADVSTIIRFQSCAISSLISHLDLHDFTIVGSSLGGWVSMDLAVNLAKPSGLVLIDTAGVVPLSDPSFRFGLEQLVNIYNAGENSMAPVLKDILDDSDPEATLMDERLIENADFNVSVIWGIDDPILNVSFGKSFSSRLKKHCFHTIENGGHTPFTVKPDAVADLINKFVRVEQKC